MIVYILQGVIPQQDDGSEETYVVLGVYESREKAEDTQAYAKSMGWETFSIIPCKFNEIPNL